MRDGGGADEDGSDGEAVDAGGDSGHERNVTHQDCPPWPLAAPLVICTPHATTTPEPAHAAAIAVTPVAATATATAMTTTTPWLCRRCAWQQPVYVRQGFLRHGLRLSLHMASSGWRHDHSP